MNVGDKVVVCPPFNHGFAGQHTIVAIEYSADGQEVYYIDEIVGGFSSSYLQIIEGAI